MPEHHPDLHASLSHVDTDWSAERTEQALGGMYRKRKRRAAIRGVVAGVASLALVASVYAAWRSAGNDTRTHQATHTPPPAAASRVERLRDGSSITRRTPDTAHEVVEDSGVRTVVRLVRGSISVERDAPPRAPSSSTILSHRVSIEVHAASVWAGNTQTTTEVAPVRGHLIVTAGARQHRVESGERATFPVAPAASAGVPSLAASTDAAPPAAPPASGPGANADAAVVKRADGTGASVHAPRAWRRLASAGNYDDAYRALAARGLDTVRDRVDDLLLAADVARISRHPRDAVRPLSRVVARFPADPRASLAAFTLGRVQLDDLKQPLAAARAFRKAQVLSAHGPLVEDALAREVEAWSRGGKPDLAKLRGREYLARYPRGHRRQAVKQYAGL